MAITLAPGQIVGQGEWEALFAQHGWVPDNSPPTRRARSQEEMKAAGLAGDPDPAAQQRPIYRYVLADGSYVDARTSPDGQGYEIIEYKPAQAFQQSQRQASSSDEAEGATRGPQTGPKREVKRGGQWVPEDNPLYQRPDEKPEGQPKEGDTRGPQTGPKREVYRGGQWTTEPNPVYTGETGSKRTATRSYAGTDPKTGKPATVTEYTEGSPTYEEIKPKDPGAPREVRQYTGTDPKTGKPAIVTEYDRGEPTYQEIKPGQQQPIYSQVTQDKDTGKWWGLKRDGSGWVELPPGGPGSPTGPRGRTQYSVPQIVLGAAQQSLIAAYDDIQAEVDAGRQSPAWGENRRAEVFNQAQLAMSEARMIEQSRQFNASHGMNVAQYGQSALMGALRVALSVNGKAPKGSGLGARLFSAVFSTQMRMARDAGIYDPQSSVGLPGVRAGVPPTAQGQARAGDPATRPPMEAPRPSIADEASIEAARQREAANIEAGFKNAPLPWTNSETGPSVVPEYRAGAPATIPPAAQSAPTTGTAPGATPPPPQAVPAPPPPLMPTSRQQPGDGPMLRVRDPWGNEHQMTEQQLNNFPGGRPKDYTVIGPVSQATAPAQAELDAMLAHVRGRAGERVESFDAPPDPPRFAALEQFRMGDAPPMTAPSVPQPPVVPPNPADQELPAIEAARIRATPPWLLPQDQLADLVARFGEDTVFNWRPPSMMGAA